MTAYEFEVALSFAGEDRARAAELAQELHNLGINTFYDAGQKAELWGKDLHLRLADLYQNSHFCIILISKYYISKMWAKHELRAAQARAISQDSEYVLPVRLDNTPVPGIFATTAHLEWPPENATSIAAAVLDKLREGGKAGTPRATIGAPKSVKHSTHTLNSFQSFLETLYGESNKELSKEYMYGYLARYVGYLSKAVSTGSISPTDFIRPVSWLFALASKLGSDVQNAFLTRYPNCCPNCLQPQCVCFKTGKQPPNYMPAHKVEEELYQQKLAITNSGSRIDFSFATDCIARVYPNNEVIWYHAGPGFHFSKLAEEVAEVHEAMSSFLKGRKPLVAVSDEIADVLAWLLGAWHIALSKKDIDQELYNYYFKGCPVCNFSPCRCGPYNSRPTNLVDPTLLEEIMKYLIELKAATDFGAADLDELCKSGKTAIETQNDPLGRLFLAQVVFKLRYLRSKHTEPEHRKKCIPLIDLMINRIEISDLHLT